MNTDISQAQEKSSDVAVAQAPMEVTYEAQQMRVRMVADLLEEGVRSTGALNRRLIELGVSVSRPTIIKYRNYALTLVAEETKLMNRDHIRNLEIGRLNYWLEHLTEKINALDWGVLDDNGTPIAFDMFNKMMQRLKDMGDQLHKITGLNTDVHVNIDEKRRIVFIRPQGAVDVKDTGTHSIVNSNDNNDHISEGQIIQSSND